MMTSEGQSHQRLGDFEILRELGRGGMGVVRVRRRAPAGRGARQAHGGMPRPVALLCQRPGGGKIQTGALLAPCDARG